jgi:hypothetical protein
MNRRRILYVVLIYFLSILSVVLLWKDVLLLSSVLIILSIIFLTFWHRKKDIITFIFGVIFGWVTESICIYFGAWAYTNTTFLVPFWLPILWGIAAMIMRRFFIETEELIR